MHQQQAGDNGRAVTCELTATRRLTGMSTTLHTGSTPWAGGVIYTPHSTGGTCKHGESRATNWPSLSRRQSESEEYNAVMVARGPGAPEDGAYFSL